MFVTQFSIVLMVLGAVTLLIALFMLQFEVTGVLGRIPTRINNVLMIFGPACIALSMITYWLR